MLRFGAHFSSVSQPRVMLEDTSAAMIGSSSAVTPVRVCS
jgi:hypothetical protein